MMRPTTPIKIYVAAPWGRKEAAIEVGKILTANGYEVTSSWFNHEGSTGDSAGLTHDREYIRTQALQDMDDVMRSDVLLVLNLEKSEGKAVETGIALAHAIPVIALGTRSNIFQTLGLEVDTLTDAIEAIHEFYPRPADMMNPVSR